MEMQKNIFQSEVKESSQSDLTVTHFISTERPDRGGDILYADGMKVEGKPVVLFAHGFGPAGSEPIAKSLYVKKGEFKNRKGIQAKTQFYPDDLGKRLWKKTTEGYMPNWSVGWRPIKQETKVENGQNIRHVYEWELLEYSLVAVPMQPDAQNVDKAAVLCFKVLPRTLDGKNFLVDGVAMTKNQVRGIVEGILTKVIREEVERVRGKVK
jgi:hypothetical protein